MACRGLVAILLSLGAVAVMGELTPLKVHVLVPYDNPVYSTESTLPAMELAVDDINNNSAYLNGYNLSLIVTNTECDPPEGTWQLISTQMKYGRQVQMVYGGGCSLVTEPTAALTSRFYEIIQVAYAASSPVLSDRQMYRYFFRVNPSETVSNPLRYALMGKYDWRRVATLHQTRNLFSRTVEDFYDNLSVLGSNFTRTNESDEANSNEGATLFSFTDDPDIPLTQIKEKKIRIVFGFMYEDKALIVMCYAYHMGLNTNNHQWILPAWYADNWWDKAENVTWDDYRFNCTADQIRSVVNHSLLLDAYLVTMKPNLGIGRTFRDFNASYQRRLDERFMTYGHEQHSYAGVAYDGLWAIAVTLNKTEEMLQTERNCSLRNLSACNPAVSHTNLTGIFFDFMNETDFPGVSGNVKYDVNGTRISPSALYQYQPNLPGGNLEKVLLTVHDSEINGVRLDNFTNSDPIWPGGRPPADRSTPRSMLLNQSLIYVCNLFISIGIVVSFAVLIFNLATIWKPLIANSAPLINTVVTVGCIMLLVACYLLGIDSGTPSVVPDDVPRQDILNDGNLNDYGRTRYAILCSARLWIITIGFTLSFGALFAKTWQAYRIYTTPSLKDKPFKYWNFLILMGLQLFVDINYLWVWTAFFRFRHAVEIKPNPEQDTQELFEQCYCEEFPYLIGALYVYKGLLVIFGLFLAYESRNVKYFYLNDSRFVSVAMYIVVILIGITAPLSLVLSTQFFIDAAYGLSVFMIVLACMCCLLILFIPKFIYMAKGLDTMLPAAKTETFTPVDGLQLGRTEVNTEDLETVEKEIAGLKKEVEQKDLELEALQHNDHRRASEDSGVHCISETVDSNSSTNTPDTMKEATEP